MKLCVFSLFLMSSKALSVQFSWVSQSCLTLCDLMDCNIPGLPIHHRLPEFTQTHIRWVSDAIQPSHPVTPFSSCPQSFPASGSFPMSQHFASGGQSIGFSFNISPSNVHPGLIFIRMDWLELPAVQGTLKSLFQYYNSKYQFFWTQLSL